MVVHYHPGMDAPAGLLTGFAKRFEPQLAVGVVAINIPPLIPARHDVIGDSGIFNVYLTCH